MKRTSSKPLFNSLLVFGLALGLASGQARAYNPVTDQLVVRTDSCGQFNENLQKGADTYKFSIEWYINGITDGINIAAVGKANYFEGTDLTSQFQFVKKYCEENPLDPMSKAIGAMIYKITGKDPTKLSTSPAPAPCKPTVNGKKTTM